MFRGAGRWIFLLLDSTRLAVSFILTIVTWQVLMSSSNALQECDHVYLENRHLLTIFNISLQCWLLLFICWNVFGHEVQVAPSGSGQCLAWQLQRHWCVSVCANGCMKSKIVKCFAIDKVEIWVQKAVWVQHFYHLARVQLIQSFFCVKKVKNRFTTHLLLYTNTRWCFCPSRHTH